MVNQLKNYETMMALKHLHFTQLKLIDQCTAVARLNWLQTKHVQRPDFRCNQQQRRILNSVQTQDIQRFHTDNMCAKCPVGGLTTLVVPAIKLTLLATMPSRSPGLGLRINCLQTLLQHHLSQSSCVK